MLGKNYLYSYHYQSFYQVKAVLFLVSKFFIFENKKSQKFKHVLKTISALEDNIYTFFWNSFSLRSGYMYHFISLAQPFNTVHHFLPFIRRACLVRKTSLFFSKCQVVLQANIQTLVKQQSSQKLLDFRLFLSADGMRRAAADLEGSTHIPHPALRSFHPKDLHLPVGLQRTALSTPSAQKLT